MNDFITRFHKPHSHSLSSVNHYASLASSSLSSVEHVEKEESLDDSSIALHRWRNNTTRSSGVIDSAKCLLIRRSSWISAIVLCAFLVSVNLRLGEVIIIMI